MLTAPAIMVRTKPIATAIFRFIPNRLETVYKRILVQMKPWIIGETKKCWVLEHCMYFLYQKFLIQEVLTTWKSLRTADALEVRKVPSPRQGRPHANWDPEK